MTLRSFRFEAPVLAHNFVSLRLNQLQTDLVITARNWAMDEMGAAISHQLGEPLTALLLYLHEIKNNRHSGDPSRSSVESAEVVSTAVGSSPAASAARTASS